MNQRRSRRAFLRGRLPDSGTSALPPSEADAAPLAGLEPTSAALWHITRRAMACEFDICLKVGLYPHAPDAAYEALELVTELESQMTYFRDSSELSRINALAATMPVPVERRLFDLLQLARQIYEQTEGAYDLTSAPLWELWGFARREGAVPTPQQIDEARRVVGFDLVELDESNATVRFRREGVRLNLGSIGKGYALDRAAELLRAAGVVDFLLSGGFSSMLAASGAPLATSEASAALPEAGGPIDATSSASEAWSVGIRNPLRLDRRLGQFRLLDRGLSTSGSYIQSFRFEGRRFGHIIDPRRGWPAEDVLSATVLAPTAALAEALSTAAYVLGPDRAAAYCRQKGAGLLMMIPARRGGGIEMLTEGLSTAEVALDDVISAETTRPQR